MSNGRPLSETVSDYIKSNSKDWVKMFDMGQLQSNIMLPYVLLYKRLKKEIELFNELHLSTKTGHKNSKNSHGNLNIRQTLSKC